MFSFVGWKNMESCFFSTEFSLRLQEQTYRVNNLHRKHLHRGKTTNLTSLSQHWIYFPMEALLRLTEDTDDHFKDPRSQVCFCGVHKRFELSGWPLIFLTNIRNYTGTFYTITPPWFNRNSDDAFTGSICDGLAGTLRYSHRSHEGRGTCYRRTCPRWIRVCRCWFSTKHDLKAEDVYWFIFHDFTDTQMSLTEGLGPNSL